MEYTIMIKFIITTNIIVSVCCQCYINIIHIINHIIMISINIITTIIIIFTIIKIIIIRIIILKNNKSNIIINIIIIFIL